MEEQGRTAPLGGRPVRRLVLVPPQRARKHKHKSKNKHKGKSKNKHKCRHSFCATAEQYSKRGGESSSSYVTQELFKAEIKYQEMMLVLAI